MTREPALPGEAASGSPPDLGFQKRQARKGGVGSHVGGTGLTIPAVFIVCALLLVPIVQAIYYSMTSWNGITSTWVGPRAYAQLLGSSLFWRVLENNGILLCAVPVTVASGLVIAVLLNERVPGWRLFRSAIIIPTAVSWVVLGVVGIQAFASHGVINTVLRSAGMPGLAHNWLASPMSAILSVAVTFVYSLVGINTLIFTTGMSTVDPAIYEAAKLDGAGAARTLVHITVPLLRRYFQFAFVVTVISAFSALFSLIFTMTGGGPDYGTTTIEFFIYEKAFATGDFGTGAMLGVILFIMLAGITALQVRILWRGDNEEG